MSRAGLLLAPLLLVASGCNGCWELVTGPEAQVRRALRSVSPVQGEDTRLEAAFVGMSVEVDGDRAVAFTRTEVEGTLRGVETSCLCVEAVPFERSPDGWRPEGFPLPRLAAVAEVLDARRRAFDAGDREAYLALVHPEYLDGDTDRADLAARVGPVLEDPARPRQTVLSRVMRIDRDRAVVTESWRLELPSGPVEGRARYVLAPHAGNWRFTSGLM